MAALLQHGTMKGKCYGPAQVRCSKDPLLLSFFVFFLTFFYSLFKHVDM